MKKMIFELEGFNCAGCINKIETAIIKLEGVENCKINFVTSTMKVEGTGLDSKEITKIFLKYEPNVKIELEEEIDSECAISCSCEHKH